MLAGRSTGTWPFWRTSFKKRRRRVFLRQTSRVLCPEPGRRPFKRRNDVLALLPDEESVQLEVFADDDFADRSHAGVASLTLPYNDADQVGNSNAPHPALSPSDGERVAEGRVRGKRNGQIVWVFL